VPSLLIHACRVCSLAVRRKEIHPVLMIEKPTLRELLKELIVRCVRSMLPPSG
jgi:hypothetical protein